MQEEIWKPIPGYEGYYEVSDSGRVRSVSRKILKRDGKICHISGVLIHLNACPDGYPNVKLNKNGRKTTFRVHRLVAISFVCGYEKSLQVNHKNGVRDDNRAENLEWVTCSENHLHSFRELGRVPGITCGESHYGHKVTEAQVRYIRSMKQLKTAKELSSEVGISKCNVYKILARTAWRHVA